MAQESSQVSKQLEIENHDSVSVESQLLLERETFRKALSGYLSQFQKVLENTCQEYEVEIQKLQDQNMGRSSVSSLYSTTDSKSDGIPQYLTDRMDLLLDKHCALAKKLDKMQTENRAADMRTHSLLFEFNEKIEKTVSEKMETILNNLRDASVIDLPKTGKHGLGACPGLETAAFLSTTQWDLPLKPFEEELQKDKGEKKDRGCFEQHEEWKETILEKLSALQYDFKEQKSENTILNKRLEGAVVRITQLEQEKSEKKAAVDTVNSKLDDVCQKISEQSVQFNDRLSELTSQLDAVSDSVDESLKQKCSDLRSDLEAEVQQLQGTISQENLGRFVQLKTYESDEKSRLEAHDSQRSCTAVQLNKMAQEIKQAVHLGRKSSTSQSDFTGRLDVLYEKVNGLSDQCDQRFSALSPILDERIVVVQEKLEKKCADLQLEFSKGLQTISKETLNRFVQCKDYELDVIVRNAACESEKLNIARQLQEMDSKLKQKASAKQNSVTDPIAVVQKFRADVETRKQQKRESLASAPRMNLMLVKLNVSVDSYLLGDIVLRLDCDAVPEIANEFYMMCVGQHGEYNLSGGDIFRVIPGNGIWLRPRSYAAKDCSAGRAQSIPGPVIPLRGKGYHSKAGLISVSMSEWPCCMITLGPAWRLDGVNTIVGEVTQGLEWIHYIGKCGSPNGYLTSEILIKQCSGY